MCTCTLPLLEEVRLSHLTQSYHWGAFFVLSCSHVVVEEEQLASHKPQTLQKKSKEK